MLTIWLKKCFSNKAAKTLVFSNQIPQQNSISRFDVKILFRKPCNFKFLSNRLDVFSVGWNPIQSQPGTLLLVFYSKLLFFKCFPRGVEDAKKWIVSGMIISTILVGYLVIRFLNFVTINWEIPFKKSSSWFE